MGWSGAPKELKASSRHVSIPERVWGGLEPLCRWCTALHALVSIPERVWGGLEPPTSWRGTTGVPFQSLRGFGVGWSGLEPIGIRVNVSFNP